MGKLAMFLVGYWTRRKETITRESRVDQWVLGDEESVANRLVGKS